MVGPFTNDFVGGMLCAIIIALVTWMGTFVWMLYHMPRDEGPEDGNPFVEPDPVPGMMATLEDEWRDVNRDLEDDRS